MIYSAYFINLKNSLKKGLQNLWIHCILYKQSRLRSALVAKLVDAQDLKSCGLQTPCRFDSGPGHHLYKREVAQLGSAPGLGPGGRRFKSCLPDHLKWGLSSAGRAPALHAGGQEFDPPRLHHFYWSGSSVGLECRPVTAEVAGSSPVQTAILVP